MALLDFISDNADAFTVIGGAATGIANFLGAREQGKAVDRATGVTQRQFNQIREDTEPFRLAGVAALDRLLAENIGPLEETPNFQFQRDQGEQAIRRSLGARGKRLSGQSAQAAGDFATNLARRFSNDRTQTLASIAGFGPGAVSANTSAGLQTGGTLSNLALAGGDARASSFAAPVNAFNSTLNDLIGQAALRGAFV